MEDLSQMPRPQAAKTTHSAPLFRVADREIVAIEHPMVIKNIDEGLKTFGKSVPLHQILHAGSYEDCLPLYLRPDDPMCAPTLSHNACTNNVLLKIEVPKRTGRKRKRGSQDPYEESFTESGTSTIDAHATEGLRSHARKDSPQQLLQSLRDNIGKYTIEAVGTIAQTHRYRGLADFHQSTTHHSFMTKVRENLLDGELSKIKNFKFSDSRGPVTNDELIIPPSMSDRNLPFLWSYHQNPVVRLTTDATGTATIQNANAPPKVTGQYVRHDIDASDIPTASVLPPPTEPLMQELVQLLKKAQEIRPIWTRRAITNYIGDVPGAYLMKQALQHMGYLFRGGPWRDAIVKFGLDPRSDPKYRQYQTLFFKLYDDNERKAAGITAWQDIRSEYTKNQNKERGLLQDSHIFDGTKIFMDGKVWQVCDITDPLLRSLLDTENLREECDTKSDGWYLNGTWAKVKAVMRTKLTAIRMGKTLTESTFDTTLALPDHVDKQGKPYAPMPDIGAEEYKVGRRRKRLLEAGVYPERTQRRRRRKLDPSAPPRKRRPVAKRTMETMVSEGGDSRVAEAMKALGEVADSGVEEVTATATPDSLQQSVDNMDFDITETYEQHQAGSAAEIVGEIDDDEDEDDEGDEDDEDMEDDEDDGLRYEDEEDFYGQGLESGDEMGEDEYDEDTLA